MKVKINKKTIDLTSANVSVDDLNDPDSPFNPGQVQIVVDVNGRALAYQTTGTLDVGGVSSTLAINEDSGGFEEMLNLLEDHDAINEDGDEIEQICAAGEIIGEALDVQSEFDKYMSSMGSWTGANGMDANSERFVSQSGSRNGLQVAFVK